MAKTTALLVVCKA